MQLLTLTAQKAIFLKNSHIGHGVSHYTPLEGAPAGLWGYMGLARAFISLFFTGRLLLPVVVLGQATAVSRGLSLCLFRPH